jgi:hypothetical protein
LAFFQDVCNLAAKRGHLDLIARLDDEYKCLDDVETVGTICCKLSETGNVQGLQWLHERIEPELIQFGNQITQRERLILSSSLIIDARMYSNHSTRLDIEGIAKEAAMNGHVPVLEWLMSVNIPCFIKKMQKGRFWETVACSAVVRGHVHVVEWIDKSTCFWMVDKRYCQGFVYLSIQAGKFNMLKYLVENGYGTVDTFNHIPLLDSLILMTENGVARRGENVAELLSGFRSIKDYIRKDSSFGGELNRIKLALFSKCFEEANQTNVPEARRRNRVYSVIDK